MNSQKVNEILRQSTGNKKLKLTCDKFDDEHGNSKARVHLHVGSKPVKYWDTDGHCDFIAVSHASKFAKKYYAKGDKATHTKKSILRGVALETTQKMKEIMGFDLADIKKEFGESAAEANELISVLNRTAKQLAKISK